MSGLCKIWLQKNRPFAIKKKDCLFAIMDSSYSPYRFNLVDGWGIWWWLATTDPLRGSLLRLRLSPSCASASASLAWSCPWYAISDGGFGRHGGMGARRHGGKLLHPCCETAIFRVLVGSHPLHAKACPYLWAAFVWGVRFKWKSRDNKFIKIFTSAVKKTKKR